MSSVVVAAPIIVPVLLPMLLPVLVPAVLAVVLTETLLHSDYKGLKEEKSLEERIREIQDEKTVNELLKEKALLDSLMKPENRGSSSEEWGELHRRYSELDIKTRRLEQESAHAVRLKKSVSELLSEVGSEPEVTKYALLSSAYNDIKERYSKECCKNSAGDSDSYAAAEKELRDIKKRIKLLRSLNKGDAEVPEELMQPVVPSPSPDSGGERASVLKHDIIVNFSKVETLSAKAAEELRPFYEEAMSECTELRLDLLRTKINMAYAALREQTILNSAFRDDALSYIPILKSLPNTEQLVERIESYINGGDISRSVYSSIFEEIFTLLEDAASNLIFRKVHDTARETLESQGYRLREESREAKPGVIQFLDSPHRGYRVAMNITESGRMSARLVRVVGSEAEKRSVSSYQKQKDAETARKWCESLKTLEDELLKQGIELSTLVRVEPGEDSCELPIIVDAELQKTASAESVESGELKEREQGIKRP